MNTSNSIDGVEPPYTNSTQPHQGEAYIFVIGFFAIVLLLMSLTYTSYICKRSRPPPPSIRFRTTTYGDANNHDFIRISCGLDDDVLVTFPTFLYRDAIATMSHKGDCVIDSSCSICLADYKPADVVRLLPMCGHLYHVTCIDTWLKAHPTCPMCRNMPLSGLDGVTSPAEFTD